MAYDNNFSFAPVAPINLSALMALRQKNPGLFGNVSQKDLTGLVQAMMKWRQQNTGGQINFGGDNDPSAGYYTGPQDTNAYG